MEALSQAHLAGRAIIDVRSEGEYQLGHLPGAVNIPLLNNHQRHLVGITYKHEGSQAAVALGLELFARKADRFVTQIAALNKQELLLYCWRGGMRSEFSSRWLRACGFKVDKLNGGYKAFRRQVLAIIDQAVIEKNFVVLNGQTGVGKTAVIAACITRGLPAIDLEGLAHHRGSLFGGLAQDQPPATQQNFENGLAFKLFKLRAAPTLIVEIEGAIGPVIVPHPLQRKMRSSPMVYLEAGLEDRVARIVEIYFKDWNEDAKQQFFAALEQCHRFISREHLAEISAAIHNRNFGRGVALLLRERYDQAYQKSLDQHRERCLARFLLPSQQESLLTFLASLTG